MGWHRWGTIFLRFQSLTRAWSKFDQGVEKALCCAQKLHGRHICCMGEYMVMISVTYMGFSVFVLLTAMVNGPKLGNFSGMMRVAQKNFRYFRRKQVLVKENRTIDSPIGHI